MKILDLVLYSTLLLGLSADVHHEERETVESTTASLLKLNATAYINNNDHTIPQWLIEFFQLDQVVEPPVSVTLEQDVWEEVAEAEEALLHEVLPEEEVVDPASLKLQYVYGEAVPETERVEDSYFADAAIIGDSRSQGLMGYGGLEGGANLTGLGLSVYNIWDKQYVSTSSGNLTCLKALEQGTYEKVYIGLGINSVGYPSREKFYNNYATLIDEVRLRQPTAVIYVQSIIPLNEAMLLSRGYASYFTNEVVREFNGYIQKLASEKDLYYLDLYEYFLDDSGQLPKEASGDGIHLTANYAKIWAEFLRTHTVDEEVFYITSANVSEPVISEEVVREEDMGEGTVAAS